MQRSARIVLILGLSTGAGCNPATEPPRFTPAPSASAAPTKPGADRSAADRNAPLRNIQMH